MSENKQKAQNIAAAWEYYYKSIRDTTDVNGQGYRLNPVAAGELQNLIANTITLLNDITRQEATDETD